MKAPPSRPGRLAAHETVSGQKQGVWQHCDRSGGCVSTESVPGQEQDCRGSATLAAGYRNSFQLGTGKSEFGRVRTTPECRIIKGDLQPDCLDDQPAAGPRQPIANPNAPVFGALCAHLFGPSATGLGGETGTAGATVTVMMQEYLDLPRTGLAHSLSYRVFLCQVVNLP
eukprot:1137303-Pelagomonas_calceolata.AAC.6